MRLIIDLPPPPNKPLAIHFSPPRPQVVAASDAGPPLPISALWRAAASGRSTFTAISLAYPPPAELTCRCRQRYQYAQSLSLLSHRHHHALLQRLIIIVTVIVITNYFLDCSLEERREKKTGYPRPSPRRHTIPKKGTTISTLFSHPRPLSHVPSRQDREAAITHT